MRSPRRVRPRATSRPAADARMPAGGKLPPRTQICTKRAESAREVSLHSLHTVACFLPSEGKSASLDAAFGPLFLPGSSARARLRGDVARTAMRARTKRRRRTFTARAIRRIVASSHRARTAPARLFRHLRNQRRAPARHVTFLPFTRQSVRPESNHVKGCASSPPVVVASSHRPVPPVSAAKRGPRIRARRDIRARAGIRAVRRSALGQRRSQLHAGVRLSGRARPLCGRRGFA